MPHLDLVAQRTSLTLSIAMTEVLGTPQSKHLIGGRILFFGCLIAFIASPLRDTTDSFLTLHTAVSLARGLWGDIAPIAPTAILPPSAVSLLDGRTVSIFPIGPAFLLAPIAWVADRLFSDGVEWFLRTNSYFTHKVFASIIGALTIVTFHKAMLLRFDRGTAIVLAVILAFATSIWSTTTRGLWTHGPLVMWVCVAFYFTLGRHSAVAATLAGAATAAAFAMRPTGIIAMLAIGSVFTWRGPRALGWYAVGGGIALSLWAALQIATYGQLVPAYYNPTIELSVSPVVAEAIVGNLASPSRGLFVYSPVLLFAIPGIFRSIYSRADRPMGMAIVLAVVTQWLVISFHPMWWGGYAFGPRLMTDVLPFLVLAIGYWLASPRQRTGWLSMFLRRAAFPVLFGLSVVIHAQGAFLNESRKWMDSPPIDDYPARLWSWQDPQVFVLPRWYQSHLGR
jgi:hypothetical protein